MKKYAHVFNLFMVIVFCTSCGGQNKTDQPENIKSETKDKITSQGLSEKYHTQNEYTDSNGKSLIIQNSYPRGGMKYTAPDGEVYGYVIFWTRMINETFDALKVTIDFPLDSIEFPSSSGRYMKLLMPVDTMTHDKEHLFDYGLNTTSFLDNHRDKSSSFKRTIDPGDSSAFYVVILSKWKPVAGRTGVLRPALSLREQDLFHTISSYMPSTQRPPTFSLASEKEIRCGSINLILK